jgi:hypothetical protein
VHAAPFLLRDRSRLSPRLLLMPFRVSARKALMGGPMVVPFTLPKQALEGVGTRALIAGNDPAQEIRSVICVFTAFARIADIG